LAVTPNGQLEEPYEDSKMRCGNESNEKVNNMKTCGGNMKISSLSDDHFTDMIRKILLSGGVKNGRDGLKSRIFAEVQHYSMELQEVEHSSDLFFRLCELIVDCQSLSMPHDSFRVMVAYLLCESQDSQSQLDEEVRKLLGMDPASFETAKEYFKNQQCIVSSLNRGKISRKRTMTAWKGNGSQVYKTFVSVAA
jgi:hypothetical protein